MHILILFLLSDKIYKFVDFYEDSEIVGFHFHYLILHKRVTLGSEIRGRTLHPSFGSTKTSHTSHGIGDIFEYILGKAVIDGLHKLVLISPIDNPLHHLIIPFLADLLISLLIIHKFILILACIHLCN